MASSKNVDGGPTEPIKDEPRGMRPRGGRMKTRTALWLARSILGLSLVLAVLTWLVHLKNGSVLAAGRAGTSAWDSHQWLLWSGTTLLLCAPGALIMARRPSNSIGWLLCTLGLLAGIAGFAGEYGPYAMFGAADSLPGGLLAMWLNNLLFVPFFGLMPLLFLLFPTGKAVSGGWRVVGLLTVATTAYLTVSIALGFDRLGTDSGPANPTYVPWLAAHVSWDGFMAALLLLLFLALGSLTSVGVRYEQAYGVERQQLKWFAYGAVILLLCLLGALPALASGLVVPILVGFGLFTTCIAIAILRYRLYDIDRLVNRTLVYSLLTLTLGLVYTGGVLLLRQLSSPLTGRSNLAVAGSTLATAALFQPARRAIQDSVDRRFNRRRYDAAKTIEAFSARLRDQLDLDTLTAELLAVVDRSVQPTQASLWLRPAARRVEQSKHQVDGT